MSNNEDTKLFFGRETKLGFRLDFLVSICVCVVAITLAWATLMYRVASIETFIKNEAWTTNDEERYNWRMWLSNPELTFPDAREIRRFRVENIHWTNSSPPLGTLPMLIR